MSLKSTVGVAKTGTTSLRATIPEGIVAFLELKAGDKLDWKMEMIDDRRIAILEKVTSPEDKMNRIKLKYVPQEGKKKNE